MKTNDDKLGELFDAFVTQLATQLQDKDCPPSVMSVARQFLKDQRIEVLEENKEAIVSYMEDNQNMDIADYRELA